MQRTIIIIFLLLNFTSFAQNDSINTFQREITELKLQNEILSQKIEIYQNTNDKIVNITFLSIGALVAFIIGLGIWNSVVSYRINNKKVDNLKIALKEEFNSIIEKQVDQKVKISKFNLGGRISKLESKFLDLEIEILKLKTVSKKFQPDINIETFSLSDLLDKTYEKYKKSSAFDYELKNTLEALIEYTNKYPDLPNHETDRIYRSLIKVDEEKFNHLTKVIKENLHNNIKG